MLYYSKNLKATESRKATVFQNLGHAALLSPFLPLNLNGSEGTINMPYSKEEDKFWELISGF